MARVFRDADAPLTPLEAKRVAVIGYGNQGRAWAQNLRDSGVDVRVGTIGDASRDTAAGDGFDAHEVEEAARQADVVCLLIPDEVMGEVVAGRVGPALSPGDALCFASGYAVAFGEVEVPTGVDVMMVAPRMLGVGVRETFVSGEGFVAFAGVEEDATGSAWPVCLALARAIGATRRGCLELSFHQEAVIDLFMEQGIAPALGQVWQHGAMALLEAGLPIEAILVEFVLSGEVERTYRALREIGYAKQAELHSQTSQYGTLSRRDRFADLDVLARLREVVRDIGSGDFAKEWAEERATGYPRFRALKEGGQFGALSEVQDRIREMFEP
ncbi:MAG: NAD(P)-binding domain-containing protein [Actinomycetota bacterium]